MAAYTEEKFFTRGTKFGKDWRISVLQDSGAGAGDRITAKEDFFKRRYPFSVDRDFWKQKIIEPVLETTIRFNPDTDLSFYRGIVDSPDDTYRLQYKYDGAVESVGSIRGDMVEITEQAAAKTVTLRAKPLSIQRGELYPLQGAATYQTYIVAIGDILNQTGTDLDIYTYGEWEPPDGSADDYFNVAEIDTYHLREYAGNRSEDTQITYYEALQKIIPEAHVLLLKGGAWHLMNLAYIAKQGGNNVTRYKYTWGGTVYAQDSSASVDMRKVLDSDNLLLTRQSTSKHYAGYKRVKQRFNHKTLISSLSFDPVYLHESVGESPAEESMEFESDGSQRIRMSGTVTVKTDDTGGNFKTGQAQILLRAGDDEYNISTDAWETAGSDNDLSLAGAGQFLSTDFQFTTSVIPSDATDSTQTLLVQLRWADDTGSPFSWTTQEVEWSNVALDIINGSQAADNAAINYDLEQTQQYSEVLELPDRIFGDGPTGYSRSAIRYLNVNHNVAGTFKRKSDASHVGYPNLIMGDIMNAQRNGTRVIRAQLWTEYNVGDVITYDSNNYLVLGGDFTGYDSKWDAVLYKLDHNTGSDTLSIIYEEGNPTTASSGSSSTSSDGGLTESDANSLYFSIDDNLSEGTPATMRTNLGLDDGTADLDLNSISVNGTNLFPDNDPQDLGTGDDVTFDSVTTTGTQVSGYGILIQNAPLRVEDTTNVFWEQVVPSGGQSTNRFRMFYDGETVRFDNPDNTFNREYSFDPGDVFIPNGGLGVGSTGLVGDTFVVNGTSRFFDSITGTDADFSANLEADSLTSVTGKLLSFNTFQLRNSGDTAFQDLELSALTVNDALTMTSGNIATDNFSDWFSASPAGWEIAYDGTGDFRTLLIDELIAKAFTADVAQALAGSDFLTKSVAKVAENFTIPAVSASGTLKVEDLEGLGDLQTFEVNDWVRIRIVDTTSSPAVIGDVWGQVTSYVDNADGTQDWTFTVDYAGASDVLVGQTVYKGAIVLDYGQSGDTYIERTVLDRSSGTDFSKVPYDRIVRWTGSDPRTGAKEVLVQKGNLNGLADYGATEYGFFAGSGSGEQMTMDPTNGFRLLDDSDNIAAQLSGSNFTVGDALDYNASTGVFNFVGFSADADQLLQNLGIGRQVVMGDTTTTGYWGFGVTESGGFTGSDSFVRMFSDGAGAWGIQGRKSGNTIFRLGNTNQIASTYFDSTDLWLGNVNKSNSYLRINETEGIVAIGGGSPFTTSGEFERGINWEAASDSSLRDAFIGAYNTQSGLSTGSVLFIECGEGDGEIGFTAGQVSYFNTDDILFESAKMYGGLDSIRGMNFSEGAMRGKQVTIADDAATKIYNFDQPSYHFVIINTEARICGLSVDSTGANSMVKLFERTSGDFELEVNTGNPGGTTGADGQVTIFLNDTDGTFWINNRSGSSKDFSIFTLY